MDFGTTHKINFKAFMNKSPQKLFILANTVLWLVEVFLGDIEDLIICFQPCLNISKLVIRPKVNIPIYQDCRNYIFKDLKLTIFFRVGFLSRLSL